MDELKKEDIKRASHTLANIWLPIIVSFLTVFAVTLLIGLMDFDFSAIFTLKYWLENILYIFSGSFIFSYSYFVFIRRIKTIKGTAYAVTAAKHYSYQEIISKHQLREFLIPKVAEENERRKKDKVLKIVNKLGITYNDYLDLCKSESLILDIGVLANKKALQGKERKRFLKNCKDLVNGRFYFGYFTIDDVLTDSGDREHESDISMTERSNYHSKTILFKTASTILYSVLISTLAFKAVIDTKWLEILIKCGSLIIANTFAASMQAWKYITYRKSILDNRNAFFGAVIPADYLK